MLEYSDWTKRFIGGILIGISSSFIMLFIGRVAGISGIASQLLKFNSEQFLWRLLFIVGLGLGFALYSQINAAAPEIHIHSSVILLVIAGVLVGFGTRLGSGCTSGHGICGIARFSKRSIVATMIFMTTAILTLLIYNFLTSIL